MSGGQLTEIPDWLLAIRDECIAFDEIDHAESPVQESPKPFYVEWPENPGVLPPVTLNTGFAQWQILPWEAIR